MRVLEFFFAVGEKILCFCDKRLRYWAIRLFQVLATLEDEGSTPLRNVAIRFSRDAAPYPHVFTCSSE